MSNTRKEHAIRIALYSLVCIVLSVATLRNFSPEEPVFTQFELISIETQFESAELVGAKNFFTHRIRFDTDSAPYSGTLLSKEKEPKIYELNKGDNLEVLIEPKGMKGRIWAISRDRETIINFERQKETILALEHRNYAQARQILGWGILVLAICVFCLLIRALFHFRAARAG